MLFLLTACQTTTSLPQQELQFSGPSFRFAASQVEVKKSAAPQPQDVQGRYAFPLTIDTAVERWANQRLQATGGNHLLEVDILQSEVTEEPLPVEKGFTGLFKDQQNRRYTARLKLEINLYSPDRYLGQAGVVSAAHRSITLPESASVAERNQAFNMMITALMQQVDADLSQRIPIHLQPYLVR